MISYQALLQEIEQLVASSQKSTDEQHLREQLSAIRALCNVGLANGSENHFAHSNSSASLLATQPTHGFQTRTMAAPSQNIIQNSGSINGGKLTEEDANGESIFDF